jgi:hypothetical protein
MTRRGQWFGGVPGEFSRPAAGLSRLGRGLPFEILMSTRYNDGSHYENHQRAAELHDLAAHAHRTAAEDPSKQDHQTGQQRSRQALEHSPEAYRHTEDTHQKPTNQHGIALFGHAEIAALAYELWQARGCAEGSAEKDWFDAAGQLRSRK